jgi:hypothetical protein
MRRLAVDGILGVHVSLTPRNIPASNPGFVDLDVDCRIRIISAIAARSMSSCDESGHRQKRMTR